MARLLFIQKGARELEGLMSISSYVKKEGHEVDLMVSGKENLEEKIKKFGPDIVGMPVLTRDHYWAIENSQKVKKVNPSVLTILGGPHPTFYTKIIENEGIDGINLYEGEKSMLELLNKVDNGQEIYGTNSIWFNKKGFIKKNPLNSPLSVDEIPISDRKLYKKVKGMEEDFELQIMSSRGCPFHCNFCINYGIQKYYQNSFFRTKKPEVVIQEIKNGRKNRNIKNILFQDDIFGINKKWLREFSQMYKKEVGLPFYSLLRCDVITTEFIDTLKDMGVSEVGIGVESGNERIRNDILGKKLPTEKIKMAVQILKDKKVHFHTFSMFGLPTEKLKNSWETINLNIELRPDVAYTQIFHPYPGTKFFDYEAEKKIINKNFNKFAVNRSYSKDSKKIQRLQKLSMATIKYPHVKPITKILINLAFDRFYDKFSKFCWENFYNTKIRNIKNVSKRDL